MSPEGRFPSVAGLALSGERVRFPEDTLGAPALLLCAYRRGAQADIETALKTAGISVEMSGPTLKWAPTPDELQRCFEFGREFAQKMLGQ